MTEEEEYMLVGAYVHALKLMDLSKLNSNLVTGLEFYVNLGIPTDDIRTVINKNTEEAVKVIRKSCEDEDLCSIAEDFENLTDQYLQDTSDQGLFSAIVGIEIESGLEDFLNDISEKIDTIPVERFDYIEYLYERDLDKALQNTVT